MDGIHDLGGKHGYGKLVIDPNEEAFQTRWQASVFAIINALGRAGITHNVDYFRHAVERIDPVSYLQDGYYGRWLGAAETIMIEQGQCSQEEITAKAVSLGANPNDRIAARPKQTPDDFSAVADSANAEPTSLRTDQYAARYTIGQSVCTTATSVSGHTRLPSYARGVVGEIVACHGSWVYPDSNAHGGGEAPQQLYTVAFAGSDLWGGGGEADLEVCLDLFEPYLEGVN